jgi:hypothetical protein
MDIYRWFGGYRAFGISAELWNLIIVHMDLVSSIRASAQVRPVFAP